MRKKNLGNRMYNYNRQYFNKIDSPQKAYWVGFILGDGCLNVSDRYVLRVCLARKDKQLLYNFIDEINGSYEQVKDKKTNIPYTYAVNLSIHSKKIVQDLVKLGIPSKNKSFTTKPLNIPYQSAFWLGLFDADGCVGISYNKYHSRYLVISLSGTKEICEGFSEFLGYEGRYVYNNKSIWMFRIERKDASNIYTKLYEYDIPCLERKKKIFKKYIRGDNNGL